MTYRDALLASKGRDNNRFDVWGKKRSMSSKKERYCVFLFRQELKSTC